jgi:uncharacterized membrane protein
MSVKRVEKKLIRNELQFFSNFLSSAVWGLLPIVASLLVASLSFHNTKSIGPAIFLPKTLYFVGGIALLAFIIVGVAIVMRRRNRNVILLKQRLVEIYLSALKESALNPQLESSRPHD